MPFGNNPRPQKAAPPETGIQVVGDAPGQYGVVCYDCWGDPAYEHAPFRYYKREFAALVAFHQEAHAAWARGERCPAWPR